MKYITLIIGLLVVGCGKKEDEGAKAFREWKAFAETGGDAAAQYHLGWMYNTGTWLEQDQKEAVKWYRKSAEQRNPKVGKRSFVVRGSLPKRIGQLQAS